MSLRYKKFTLKPNKEMLLLLNEVKAYYIGNNQSTKIVDRMEEIFLKEYSFIKEALDSSTIVAVTDKYGIITYVNDKFCEISQYSRDELVGATHRTLNSGYHSRHFFKDLWDTILAGDMWSGIVKNKKKDGSFYWVQTNIIPIMNDYTGEIEQFIALRTDITKGKEAEEQLRKVIINDFERTIKNLDNMVFKIKKNSYGEFYISLVEGKLSALLDLSEGVFDRRSMKRFFGATLVDEVQSKCAEAFNGKKQSIKHHYNGLDLYTTLSPIIENNKIIEIIGNTNDITLLEIAQQEIRKMAYHDDLTNLPNRRRLTQDLQEIIEAHSGKTFAVLFVDIDRFKQINDTLGFIKGDKLIVELGKRLAEFVSNKGKAYRLSGDEFVIVLDDYQDNSLLTSDVQAILKLIEEPFLIDEHELLITCSIGVTTFPMKDDSNDKILNRVDTALKYCKLNGRQGFIFYNRDMDKNTQGRLKLEINLRKAIMNDELTLYYQPKYILDTNEMYGMEALVRWNSPVYGFVGPNQFIPLAEETGLIIQLGEWVLYQACKQTQEWISRGLPPMQVAVNISTIELKKPNFVDRVKRILEATKLNPCYLELEITENSFIENIEEGYQILTELKNLGINISIDDFGTGYSSLGYLKKFPVNVLKIDKSFVQEIDKNENDIEIVKAMIQLGHTFHMKVIAEGVESDKVARILSQLQCDIVQGFYYSKPLPAEKFAKLLE